VVGAVGVRAGNRDISNAAARQMLAEAAGSHGANALFIINDDSRGLAGVAVWISPAKPARNYPGASDALATAARGLEREYAPDGAAASTQLEAFQPLVLAGKRGRCYSVAFALDAGADLSRHARQALGWAFKSPDGDIRDYEPAVSLDPGELLTMRSHVTHVGCPQVDGPLEMDLRAMFGSARGANVHDLGSGRVVLQAYSKAVSEEALRKQKETSQRLWKEAEEQNKARAKEQCFECQRYMLYCGERRVRDCREYMQCLSRASVQVEECQ
jgi:hypothetical protein